MYKFGISANQQVTGICLTLGFWVFRQVNQVRILIMTNCFHKTESFCYKLWRWDLINTSSDKKVVLEP